MDPEDIIEFTDPVSHNTFGARRYGGDGAAEMLLARANRMLERSDYCEGVDCLEPEGDGWTKDSVSMELNKLVQLIELTAIVTKYMDSSQPIGDPYSP